MCVQGFMVIVNNPNDINGSWGGRLVEVVVVRMVVVMGVQVIVIAKLIV